LQETRFAASEGGIVMSGRMSGRATSTEQLVERVESLVSGFRGYAESRTRRDDDGRVRIEICERIDRSSAFIEDFLLELSEEGWNPAVQQLDGLVRRLEVLRSNATSSADAYAAFFSRGALSPTALVSLLENDLSLLVDLDALAELLDGLGAPHFAPGNVRETMTTITAHVEAVERSFERRQGAARELAGDRKDRCA
jgi:hypothetical protein